uniref:Polyhedrin protein n=1 Tax=Cypovirus mosquito/0507BS3/Xinjiang TaxID=596165 RepID=C0JAK3_9REOV|nr:polyhedrin protein [Cypovirus mosquito/0507BS3/Xinjiang]
MHESVNSSGPKDLQVVERIRSLASGNVSISNSKVLLLESSEIINSLWSLIPKPQRTKVSLHLRKVEKSFEVIASDKRKRNTGVSKDMALKQIANGLSKVEKAADSLSRKTNVIFDDLSRKSLGRLIPAGYKPTDDRIHFNSLRQIMKNKEKILSEKDNFGLHVNEQVSRMCVKVTKQLAKVGNLVKKQNPNGASDDKCQCKVRSSVPKMEPKPLLVLTDSRAVEKTTPIHRGNADSIRKEMAKRKNKIMTLDDVLAAHKRLDKVIQECGKSRTKK